MREFLLIIAVVCAFVFFGFLLKYASKPLKKFFVRGSSADVKHSRKNYDGLTDAQITGGVRRFYSDTPDKIDLEKK